MKAISTKYLGPTNYKGSRIKASDEDGNSITIGSPHEANMGPDAHSVAALALCRKMGWTYQEHRFTHLLAGGLKDSYVFVFAVNPGNLYDCYPLPKADQP